MRRAVLILAAAATGAGLMLILLWLFFCWMLLQADESMDGIFGDSR